MNFDELNLSPEILEALDAMRFESCTPIQARAIPPLLQGRDIIGIAQTGTGKTAAYLLPILNRLLTEDFPEGAVNCVIMVPTRELAQQIDHALEGFSYFIPVSGVAVYGGNDGIRYEQELRSLKLGADIIIATPGRLISHIQLGNVDLSHTGIFVLDEADRMLDMGFIDDVKQIASMLPEKRQTMLFSATMPSEIKQLSKQLLHDPVSIEIAIAKPAEKIDQSAYLCHEAQKTAILNNTFRDPDLKRVIIFSSSKRKVKDLAEVLRQRHIKVAQMHSDLSQAERDQVMRDFKAGRTDVIVSTDLLSRGIDIDDIEMVINFDVPRNADDYVHRIGRTARADRYGKAITLISDADRNYFKRIERVIGREVRKEPLPDGIKGDADRTTQSGRPHRSCKDREPDSRRRNDHKRSSRRNRRNRDRRSDRSKEGAAKS